MKKTMQAMVLDHCAPLTENPNPLRSAELPVPIPRSGEILIEVKACGVCRTDLDDIEARTAPSFFPIILGHQVVGVVRGRGERASRFTQGSRVGVGWIHSACGECEYCLSGRENLCARFGATGRDADGGYAEYAVVPEGFAAFLPDSLADTAAAPLLCAGAVGYRALRLSGITDGDALGFSGFGASGHIVLQAARTLFPRLRLYVFARSPEQRRFALSLGADWTGSFDETPPRPLDAVIDTTPVWEPLARLAPRLKAGGRFVINAIRKESIDNEILAMIEYEQHLWLEKEIKSVANVTRRDIEEVLQLAGRTSLEPEVTVYPLADANRALNDLKHGDQRGAKVLVL
ncbi:MAG: zinc-dependent alcohol dehydrogenase family protein [Spirochaetales bacterium]|nr:zinc-dependent alcohol dehydrogenase family protein [Spirochaetales bacterium]